VIHADQFIQLYRRVDFLHALARSSGRGVLVVIDESTRQAPQAVTGLDRPASQYDPAVCFNDHRR